MREIKFRLWDTIEKKWRDEPFGVLGNGTVVGYAFIVLHESRYKLVQYTGLKDKNGKEIWEGDVVRMRGLITGHFEPMIGYVYYEPPSFQVIAIEPKDVEGKGRSLDERNSNEIIGNIYENPKLLKP